MEEKEKFCACGHPHHRPEPCPLKGCYCNHEGHWTREFPEFHVSFQTLKKIKDKKDEPNYPDAA